MNIQTISIVVPTKGCINKCPFCVSRMHENNYENSFDEFQISKRIKWAVMNGVNTCIFTGTGEALQNYHFLERIADIFRKMDYPFPNVEFQTTGVLLYDFVLSSKKDDPIIPNYYNIKMLKELGVNTISLSVSDIFEDANNLKIIGVTNKKLEFYMNELIPFLKNDGFNIRLSINMLKKYDSFFPEEIIRRCKFLGADQITFRKMYSDNDISEQSKWVYENKCSDRILEEIKVYIQGKVFEKVGGFLPGFGKFLYKLPFGASVYSIDGMSTVIDDDCMSKENNESLKYCILRENGKLYAQWDDEGSLIF
jgi:hypothetical protein